MMLRSCRVVAAVLAGLALLACRIDAQVLYSEAFDSRETARVTERVDEFCLVDYIDYSGFMLGDSGEISIPEAPRRLQGSLATRGVMLRCNVASDENRDGFAGAINLLLAEERDGSQVQFGGNFRLSFDVWMNLDEFASRSSSGTTEVTIWGVGSGGEVTQGRLTRADAAITGCWGWLANEGGFSTEDAVFFIDNAEQERKSDGADSVLFEEAFPEALPIPITPANAWVQVEVEVRNGAVSVGYNGVRFHRFEADQTEGGALIGYEDPFPSLTFSPDYQFAVFDNVVVERLGSAPLPATFAVTRLEVVPGTGNVTLTWNSQPGRAYRVEAGLHLDGDWNEVADGVPSGGATTTFTVTNNPVTTQERYYRVVGE